MTWATEHTRFTAGASVKGKRVITHGLDAGERVIVGGLMKVRPGLSVAPQVLGAESPTLLSDTQGDFDRAAAR